ncbi:MAG: phosphate-starvation-inducible PsiE family protein [Gammaproteobacteria bacterium]|nr:phosphate-starvation-inducible PsiE family protein [Gammaproteobacteria bacterium]
MKRTPQSHDSLVMRALYFVEWLGLLLISLATIVAIGQETLLMAGRGQVLLQDILLLFIYLEILTMVGLYFTSGKLPVRYPIYIAMVAIARFIIMGMKDMTGWEIVALAAAILVLALAVLAIRYGHTRMPYNE